MNLVLATRSHGDSNTFAALTATARELYGRSPGPVCGKEGAVGIASVNDGGVVLGRADDGETALVLLGALQHPVPGWEDGRPSDDPNRAAAWLLRRFRQQDLAFLDGLHGQFAVIAWDRRDDRLVVGSDNTGLRSLFAYEDEHGTVAVASNLFLLARALSNRVRPDRSLEDFFLVYGYLPWERTVFEGIRTLPKGEIHSWSRRGHVSRPIQSGDPWMDRFPPLDMEAQPEEVLLERLYEIFMAATEAQTGSAREAAVLLGGVDSALVASALHRLGKEVHTFSFHYEEAGFDQPHTDTLSRFLGSQHHWVPITPDVMRAGLERYGLCFSRPTNWPNYVIQTARVCEVIRERGIVHVHSGDGCDQTFMGYPRTHALARAYQAAPRLPDALVQTAARLAAQPWLEDFLGRPYRLAMNILRHLRRPPYLRGFLTFRIFDESSLHRLRKGPPPEQQYTIDQMLSLLTEGLEDLTPARLAYLGKAGVSANKSKLGGSSDHSGVIIWAPYLHPSLKRFAMALPDHLLRPKGTPETAATGKYVLLKMAERSGLLPPQVVYQKKVSGVDAPVDSWYAGPLRDTLLSLFQSLPFQANPRYLKRLIAPTRAATLYARHLSSDRLTSHEASLLATYAALHRALG